MLKPWIKILYIFLIFWAQAPSAVLADIATPHTPIYIWEKPYTDKLEMSCRIGQSVPRGFRPRHRQLREDFFQSLTLSVPGPCDYEITLTPKTKNHATIRHTGEKTAFGPDNIAFPLNFALQEGEKETYSLMAKIRLYRYTKKARNLEQKAPKLTLYQEFSEEEWNKIKRKIPEVLLLTPLRVQIMDDFMYTFKDKNGEERVCTDTIEVWNKEGTLQIHSARYGFISNKVNLGTIHN